MNSARFSFVPSSRFQSSSGAGLWFAFRGRELLVSDAFGIPSLPSLAVLGLATTRAQYLGTLDGEACFSAELARDAEPPPGAQFRDLRQLYGRMRESLLSVAARAVQIMEWDRTHQFCGACAAPTVPHDKARSRVCSNPGCKLEHYPRLSPAIIVAVERGEEILLARSPHFPPNIFSVLAGFVDPGESVEDAVHREVFEETGLKLSNVRYFSSQPWPFPNSLMLGYQAEHAGGELVLDPEEIEEAAFFHVDALPAMFPGRVSISQWLIQDFCTRHGRTLGAETR
jgi:NAD+ diphosphatase